MPYAWISDASRRGYFVNTYADPSDFLRREKGLYRTDLWSTADCKCEVWVESRSIAGVIQDLCEELGVSLYPAAGFASVTLAFQAADYLNLTDDGREVVVFYIGDFDKAGVLIDLSIEKELRRHLKPSIRMRFERIGITADQIETFDLPTKPGKETDKRSLQIKRTVEAEAMPASILRGLLTEKIEALLPANALVVSKASEQSAKQFFDVIAQQYDAQWWEQNKAAF